MGIKLDVTYTEDKLDSEVPSPEKHPKCCFPFSIASLFSIDSSLAQFFFLHSNVHISTL